MMRTVDLKPITAEEIGQGGWLPAKIFAKRKGIAVGTVYGHIRKGKLIGRSFHGFTMVSEKEQEDGRKNSTPKRN